MQEMNVLAFPPTYDEPLRSVKKKSNGNFGVLAEEDVASAA